VAPQGVIWLQTTPESPSSTPFNRLVRLLGFLSQALALPGRIRLLRQGEAGDILLPLSPTETDRTKLSGFYDAASAAARLVDGRLYIGQDNAYVQYRDDSAPRGYDLPDFKAHDDARSWLLVAHWGSQFLNLADFTETPLADFCLQVAPLPDVAGPPPEQVYALTPAALYPVLSKYFYAHHLRYGMAHLQGSGGAWLLFELRPRPDAPTGQAVPRFILDYLARLPRVVVLAPAQQTGNPCILVQWRQRYPLRLPHIAGFFADDSLILLTSDHDSNLHISPAPPFFEGDRAVRLDLKMQAASSLTPTSTATAALKLPVLLRPANGPTPPIAALILNAREVGWLRQLLYHLPGEAFGAYSLCQGEDRTVLVGATRPIEGIPFGAPLRRLGETELFIPLRSTFVPDLPWPLLRQALDIQDGVYTFLTEADRLDLPMADFTPLSCALMADPRRPRVRFNLRAGASLPELRWTPPPAPPAQPPSEEQEKGLFQKILKRGRHGPVQEPPPEVPTAPPADFDPQTVWREQAKAHEEASDFLTAAVCYSLLNDMSNSARCYRLAMAAVPPRQSE